MISLTDDLTYDFFGGVVIIIVVYITLGLECFWRVYIRNYNDLILFGRGGLLLVR